jgi:hypothetical protein
MKRIAKAVTISLLVSGLITGFFTNASAVVTDNNSEYTIIQLTDDDVRDTTLSFHNEFITWMKWDGSDYEIILYNTLKEEMLPITDNDLDDRLSKVHNGLVTWLQHDGNDYEIMLYDYDTGITTQVTDNDYLDNHPWISDGYITWYTTGANVFLYDYSTDTTIQISEWGASGVYPKTADGQVTWFTPYGSIDKEIFFYDYETDTLTQVSDNDYDDRNPLIDNGYVLWIGYDGNDYELHLYDSATQITTQLTDNSKSEWEYWINNELVQYRAWDGNDYEIYLYDISLKTTIQITDNSVDDSDSFMNEGYVVWRNSSGMFIYDYYSGVTKQITDTYYNVEGRLQNSKTTLAWISGQEVFLAKPSLITAIIDFDPNTLNLKSEGEFVTVYIELPVDSDYSVYDIDLGSIYLNGEIRAEDHPFEVEDYDGDGILDLKVKFNLAAVQGILEIGEVEILIAGMMVDGIKFEGTDIIWVINP